MEAEQNTYFITLIDKVLMDVMEQETEDKKEEPLETVLNRQLISIWKKKGIHQDESFLIKDFFCSQTVQLNERKYSLKNDFIDEEVKQAFCNQISVLEEQRDYLYRQEVFFLPEAVIDSYLEAYYNVLSLFLFHDKIVKGSQNLKDILILLLNLDYDEENERISFWSPMALNATKKMYLEIAEYRKRIVEQSKDGIGILNEFDISVIEKKILHQFRWYQYVYQNILKMTVPYVQHSKEAEPYILCKPLSERNSYEGIGEMRVAEKILYEIQQDIRQVENMQGESRSEFSYNIALLGDINQKPLYDMANYVQDVLRQSNERKDIWLNYLIYTKNPEPVIDTAVSNCKFEYQPLDEVFSNTVNIEQILAENHIVFMMDCIKLYEPLDAHLQRNVESEKQKYRLKGPFEYLYIDRNELCAPNYLDHLYEGMTVYAWKGDFGHFVKNANNALLKYCENVIKNTQDGRRHTLYVYVSDLRAFSNVYCSDQYYVRTERYNQKEIGIIRYVNDETEMKILPAFQQKSHASQRLVITFNVWQLIKHISLDRRQIILDLLNDMIAKEHKVQICDLHNLHIGIDFTQWPYNLLLHYAVNESDNGRKEKIEAEERFLKEFTSRIALPILSGKRDNLFGEYYWKALKSFLYSDAKDVEDMLFVHLLEIGKTGNFSIAKENDRKIVLENINVDYKYSIKRFYERIMASYDISAENSYGQLVTADVVDVGHIHGQEVGGKRSLFQKVKLACEELKYDDSYLYRNCLRML